MPKPRRKSKPRSEMSPEDLKLARKADRDYPTLPSTRCRQKDLDALDEQVAVIEALPTYVKLIEIADDRHTESNGISLSRTGKIGLKSRVLRMQVRAGHHLISNRLPTSESHLITLQEEHTRDMRYHMLEDLRTRSPDIAIRLMHFCRNHPSDLDVLIDGFLLDEFQIRSNITDFHERRERITLLWNVSKDIPLDPFTSPQATPQATPPATPPVPQFTNPYSNT